MSAPPPAAQPAPARPGLARAWGGLAALLLLAAPLGAPYEAALFSHASRFDPLSRPGMLLLQRLFEAVVIAMPLAWAGLALARPLGWGAPYLAGARPWRAAARPLTLALLVGAAVGAAVTAAAFAVPRLLPGAFPAPAAGWAAAPAAWKGALGALAAGVNEEVITRLFLVSLLARGFGLALRQAGPPGVAVRWAAIALAALAFGAMHFSNVAVLGLPHSFANLAFVLLLNGALGLACGLLFVRHGIEAAIVAHFAGALVAHGVLPALGRVS